MTAFGWPCRVPLPMVRCGSTGGARASIWPARTSLAAGQKPSRWETGSIARWMGFPGRDSWTTEPAHGPSATVHGDLSGNVLFHNVLAPAIIDLSPYWRPASYASAIVVADALLWEGADRQILDEVRDIEDLGQHLLRALIFRLVSEWLLSRHESRAAALNSAAWHQTAHLACGLAAQS